MLLIYISLGIYVLSMLFVLFYSLAQADLLWHFFKFQRRFKAPETPTTLPVVTLQLPIFNEKYVVERLIDAVAKLSYPADKLEIQVLDDSTDETQEIILRHLAKYPDVNFKYLHRKDRKGFKAGALREALDKAKGEFIAIFDADFVPDPNFLLQTMGHFRDPQVGMVQSRWTHLNENYSLLTRLQAFALDAHFMVEQTGRNAQQAFINFNGTGGIWRKSCIYDAGNWEEDTLTEDLDLSYRAQKKGWKFVYRPDIASPAELPPVMSAIKSQQFRWTKGGAECAVKHLNKVLSSPLPLKTKFHALAHLLNSTLFIAVFLSSLSSIPIWWAFETGRLPEDLFQLAVVFKLGFVIIAMVYFFANLSLVNYSWKGVLRYLWELPMFLSVSLGLGLHNAQAVWEGLTGKKSPFIRTPKYNLNSRTDRSWVKNAYNPLRIPVTTYLEAVLSVIFLAMVVLEIQSDSYAMLPFHFMLALGYALVSISSFRSYRAA